MSNDKRMRESEEIAREIAAIGECVAQLEKLPTSAHPRVLRYLYDRYVDHPIAVTPVRKETK